MTAGTDLRSGREAVARARRIVVLTGAGISAESGVPTFRGSGGLWRSFRPEELATPEAFRRDPGLVWAWYAWRRNVVAGCAPNAGHRALARLALGRAAVTLVTQNVDGLHHRAAREEAGSGTDPGPALPLELHGTLERDRCSGCGRRAPALPPDAVRRFPAGGTPSPDREIPPTDAAGPSADPPLRHCEDCGALMRPDVVWFGESLDMPTLERAFEAAAAADVCLVVGTSALVHPAASVPLATLEAGGALVEVNLERTALSHRATATLLGPAGDLLPDLLEGAREGCGGPPPSGSPGEPL